MTLDEEAEHKVDRKVDRKRWRKRLVRRWRRWYKRNRATTTTQIDVTTTMIDGKDPTTTLGGDTTTAGKDPTTTLGETTTTGRQSTTTSKQTTTTLKQTTTTARNTTTTAGNTTTLPPGDNNSRVLFSENFLTPASVDRFDFKLIHRDDFIVSVNRWQGDHAPIAGNDPDACGGPYDTRTITRGSRPQFNDDWRYRCAPVDDPAKAHLMTSIGDTSGYSTGAFSPRGTFNNVTEIRWSVNITHLGNRQWTEAHIVPAGQGYTVPCSIEWTGCTDPQRTNGQLGSVSTSFFNSGMDVHTAGSSRTVNSGSGLSGNDPAFDDVAPRRKHFLRDNGNGTMTFGIERQDGSFAEMTVTGSFPTGPVRVMFSDQNYTPLKSESGRPRTFTWHWDDIQVIGRG